MSFWKPSIIGGDGKPVRQDPVEQVSHSVRSNQSLEYKGGQVIRIDIPESVNVINPSESYLSFKVLISGANKTRVNLDSKIGAHSLIKDIKVFSLGDSNILLDELTNYNNYVSIKYDYSDSQSKSGYNATQIGSIEADPRAQNDTNNEIIKYNNNNFINNPYYKSDTSEDATDGRTTGNSSPVYTEAKIQLKLENGLFQSKKALFVNLLKGLRVEITLEDDKKVFNILDQNNQFFDNIKNRGLIFHGHTDQAGGTTIPNASSPFDANASSLYFKFNNGNIDAGRVALNAGEKVHILKHTDGTKITSGTIESIKTGTHGIAIQFTGALTLNGTEDLTTGACSLFSDVYTDTSFDPTYTIKDVDFYIETLNTGSAQMQEMISDMKTGKTIAYDFLAVQNYKYNQVVSDVVLNMRLPIGNSRCKSILCQPTDSTSYTKTEHSTGFNTYNYSTTRKNVRGSLNGIYDGAIDYQFFYQTLQPSRPINVKNLDTAVKAEHLIELEKSLDNAHIPVTSLEKFNENFVIGRAFGVNENAVYDPRNKDFNLQVNYGTMTKPHFWNNYVVHIRSILFTKTGLEVIV